MACLIFMLILILNIKYDTSLNIIDKNSEILNIEKITKKKDEPQLINKMLNEETGDIIYCDPNKYKYIKLLIKDLKKSNLDSYRIKTKSIDIEKDYLKWKRSCWITKKDKCWFWKKKMRIQIIDSQIYLSSTKYEMEEHIYDKEGYRIGLFFYLSELQRKYSKYLPNTDFILYYHDFKGSKKNGRSI